MRILKCLFLFIFIQFLYSHLVTAQANEEVTNVFVSEQSSTTEPLEFGILRIKVTDYLTQKPVIDANVVIDIPNENVEKGYEAAVIKTEKNGIASIKIESGKKGYVFPRNSGYYPPGRKSFIIKKDETTSVEFDYVPLIFTGIVKDEKNNPVQDVNVLITEIAPKVKTTDSEGKFEIEWENLYNASPANPRASYLIARDEGRNLYAIERFRKPDQKFDLILKPGLTLAGKIVDQNGKGVNNAGIKIRIKGIDGTDGIDGGYIYSTIRDSNIVQSMEDGTFEINAIPKDLIYNFLVSAKGYGRAYAGELSSIHAENNHIDIGTIVLPFSGNSFSGVGTKKRNSLLIGKELPDLNNFYKKKKLPDLENRSVIICFFDIEQRPSRNYILELSKKVEELKAKQIEVLLIHTSKIESIYIDNWLKENNISFTIGMIEKEYEQTKFNWGIKALPWLILTDKEHVVTDEGFSINDLDEKIKN